MALTEINLPSKSDFLRRLNTLANEMDALMGRWKNAAEFAGNIVTADLDAMGIAAGQARTDISDFETVLNEMVSLYEGNSVTPTNSPDAIIDKMRTF